MGKLLLGALLLLLWFWIGPEEIVWPDFGRETTSQETERETNRSEEGEAGIASSTMAMVRYVIDGDTFDTTSGARVRLLGIDTPERNECYYQEATDFARTLIHEKEVRMTADVTDKDKYDRLLRHVYVMDVDGESRIHLNLQLVEEGYAEVLPIPPDRQYREELAAAEAAAKAAGKGRWGVCE